MPAAPRRPPAPNSPLASPSWARAARSAARPWTSWPDTRTRSRSWPSPRARSARCSRSRRGCCGRRSCRSRTRARPRLGGASRRNGDRRRRRRPGGDSHAARRGSRRGGHGRPGRAAVRSRGPGSGQDRGHGQQGDARGGRPPRDADGPEARRRARPRPPATPHHPLAQPLGWLRPIDSEHSAIWQCLVGEDHAAIERLLLTASGGPFLHATADELATVTPERALRHPTWTMGAKITIDSATLANKGLEIIEARWLYDVPLSAISVVIHPQSVVHSAVHFVDGSVKAQLGTPDMRLPIQYALTYPGATPLSGRRRGSDRGRPARFPRPGRGPFPGTADRPRSGPCGAAGQHGAHLRRRGGRCRGSSAALSTSTAFLGCSARRWNASEPTVWRCVRACTRPTDQP